MTGFSRSKLPDPTLQPGETVAFDFGIDPYTAGTDAQGRLWNSLALYSDPVSYTAVAPFVKDRGRCDGLRFRCPSSSASDGPFGSGSGVRFATVLPNEVAKDGWTTLDYPTDTSNAGIFRISGLAPNIAHRVEIFGSIGDNDQNLGRQTTYKVGGQTRDLNAYNNTSNTGGVRKRRPMPLGMLQVKVYAKAGNDDEAHAVINAITVTRSGSSAPSNVAPVVNSGTDQTVTLYDGANLSGTATDDGQPAGSSLTKQWTKESGPGR